MMFAINDAHLHLLTNHIPVVAAPILAMILAWGLARRHDAVIRVALVGAVLLAPLARIAAWSGHEAEEIVEETSWSSRERIHAHHDQGEIAEKLGYLTGALGLAALFISRRKAAHRGASAAVLLSLIASSVMLGMTSYSGGKIRHDEVHGVAPDAGAPPPARP